MPERVFKMKTIVKSGKDHSLLRGILFLTFGVVAIDAHARTGAFEELTLNLSCRSGNYFPMEPIEIKLVLRNEKNYPFSGHPHVSLGDGYLRFEVRREGNEFTFFDTDSRYSRDFEPVRRMLQPGQSFSCEEILSFRWLSRAKRQAQYIFPETGRYFIRAVLRNIDYKSEIQSNVLEVNVVEPSGIDMEALNFLRSKSHRINFLLNTALPDPATKNNNTAEIVSEMEEFVNAYAESRYAKYAEFTLGVLYKRDVGAGRSAAAEMLERVLRRPRFSLTDDALYELVGYHARWGDIKKARRHLSQLERLLPGSALVQNARDTVETAKSRQTEEIGEPGDEKSNPALMFWRVGLVGSGLAVGVLLVVLLLKRKASKSKK